MPGLLAVASLIAQSEGRQRAETGTTMLSRASLGHLLLARVSYHRIASIRCLDTRLCHDPNTHAVYCDALRTDEETVSGQPHPAVSCRRNDYKIHDVALLESFVVLAYVPHAPLRLKAAEIAADLHSSHMLEKNPCSTGVVGYLSPLCVLEDNGAMLLSSNRRADFRSELPRTARRLAPGRSTVWSQKLPRPRPLGVIGSLHR